VKRLPREVRERQILDAAVTVFSRRGYHEASMDEISEVAGVSKPMLYTYLGSKENLFTASIRREATLMLEAIVAGVKPDASPETQLWQGLLAFFRFVEANRDSWRVLHRQIIAQGGPFASEVAQIRQRAIQLVAALVASSGTSAGVDSAERFAEGLAAGLVGAAESLADWWLDHPQQTAEAVTIQLMNLTWLGFGDLVAGRAWAPPAGDT
jgi:AcrR family transcriptional regulator